jgi:iron complex outermembrane receptor protein
LDNKSYRAFIAPAASSSLSQHSRALDHPTSTQRSHGLQRRAIGRTSALLAAWGAVLGIGALGSAVTRGAEPTDDEADKPLLEIVVVGSHFATPNASSISPVMVVDAEEMKHQGTGRAEDLLDSMPQLNAGLNNSSNGAGVSPVTGTATADLRGIGSFNTLVLMNSRRLNPGDSINPSPDLNAIPSILVKRVEVLTGGASSIYGSDAISGVVNFVMDTAFTGAKLETEYGINQASNGNTAVQDIERSAGINPRSGTLYDGRSVDVSAVFGKDLFDGDGHVVAYGGYRHNQGVYGSSRDFGACTLQESGNSYQCLLDGTTPAGQFVPNGGTGPSFTLDPATGNTFRPFDTARDGYNPAPFQTLTRPDTRFNAGIFGHYSFSKRADAYLEATFSDDHTSVLYENSGTTPTGSGLNVFGINCNNPLLSPGEVNTLCTQNGLGAADTAQVGIGRRSVEGNLREDDFRHRSYRVLLGVKGEINDVWTYDVNGQYGNTDSHERLTNDVSQQRLGRALNVVGVNGTPTCQSVVDGTDPACVPYNIFSAGGVTPAALRYITATGAQDGYAHQYVLDGKVLGDLSKYGIKSPLADNGLNVAVGMEQRSQTISNQPNAAYLTGDLLVTGAARPTYGMYRVTEGFAEVRVPLLENRPFAKALTLNVSDRFAEYAPQGSANAYNFGVEWSPIDAMRFRGTLSRAVRAPNGHELFLSETLSQVAASDPCANDPTTGRPSASAAACAHTGVTAAQYGKIAPANSFNQLTGGNPNLRPQIADTVTGGLVFVPTSWVPSLLVSVDYWRIKVERYIGSLAAVDSLNNCLGTGDPVYCDLIRRDANGSLSVGNGPAAGRVIATGLNTGSFEMSGIDVEGRYVLDMSALNAGKISFNLAGSVALDNTIQVVPGLMPFDCTGFYGPTCTGEGPTSPIPKWRHKMRATWEARKDFEVSVNWRHIGHLDSEQTSSNPHLATGTAYPADWHVPTYDYIDMDVGFDLGSHVNLRLGVNNLFNREPPIVGFNANPLLVNGNMLAATYDTFGRYLFVGLTAKY